MKELRRKLSDKKPFNTLSDFIENNETDKAIEYIQKYCECDISTAKILFVDFKSDYEKIFSPPSTLSPEEKTYNNTVAQEWLNKPKCPTCNSTNIKKISGLSKVGSVAMWGILSRKVHKQWHCNSCGSEW